MSRLIIFISLFCLIIISKIQASPVRENSSMYLNSKTICINLTFCIKESKTAFTRYYYTCKDSIILPLMIDDEGRNWKNIYYQKLNGQWGLYDANGDRYIGVTFFLDKVFEALEKLRKAGEFGNGFIENIDTLKNNILIRSCEGFNRADNSYVYLNLKLNEAVLTEKGSMTINFELILCHELAHAFAYVRGAKFEEWLGVLYNEEGDQKVISYSEIYATHIENEFRSELGYPLRKYYAQDKNRNPVFESKILDNNNRSLFYHIGDVEPHTDYKVLAKDERFVYKVN